MECGKQLNRLNFQGKPDNSSVDMTSRIHSIDQVLDVTTKPMIVDGDNGGFIEHFQQSAKDP